MTTYPYPSAASIHGVVGRLRNSFPKKAMDVKTIQHYGIAPQKKEDLLIKALQFISVIDGDGNPTEEVREVFSTHDDGAFAEQFGKMIEKAYPELFDLQGEQTWNLGRDELISFFRRENQTSKEIGSRQARAFIAFAELSGKRQTLEPKQSRSPRTEPRKKQEKKVPPSATSKPSVVEQSPSVIETHGKKDGFALTVRVEINLPGGESKNTYDAIFRSIKENLMNG